MKKLALIAVIACTSLAAETNAQTTKPAKASQSASTTLKKKVTKVSRRKKTVSKKKPASTADTTIMVGRTGRGGGR